MITTVDLDKCVPFIRSQHTVPPPAVALAPAVLPAVTISRECGSGGHTIAELLAHYLQSRAFPESRPWTVVDRNLVEQVLRDHGLPERMARFLPEDRVSIVADVVDELLGVRPSAWTLAQQTAATILRLANRGNVIVVGRAAHLVTRHLQNVFHVRLVGSVAKRCLRIQELHHLDQAAALRFIHLEDRGRTRYLRQHFGKAADDVVCYHLVLNTDAMSYERAAQLIGDEVLARFPARHVARGVPEVTATLPTGYLEHAALQL